MKKTFLQVALLVLALSLLLNAKAQNSLISTNTTWRYLDDGSDQLTGWDLPGFDDSSWVRGVPLFGGDSSTPYPWPFRTPMAIGGEQVTYYFRTHFQWSGGTQGVVLTASIYIDDGAVFYLNGLEAGRLRLPSPVNYHVRATNQASEGTAEYLVLSATNLVTGDNVLAVEVHQATTNSSDVVFGMTLDGHAEPTELHYTISVPAGHRGIANPLNRGSNRLNVIMRDVPAGTRLFKYNNETRNYSMATFNDIDSTWIPNPTLNPGQGAILETPTAATLDFIGVPTSLAPVHLPQGACYLLSCGTNEIGRFDHIISGGPLPGDVVYQFTSGGYQMMTFDEIDMVWTPSEPALAVGESAWFSRGGGSPPVVSSAPVITRPARTQMAPVESNVTFSVSVSGSAPLSFQWSKDGVALAGASESSLFLPAITQSQAGYYTFEASNSLGSVWQTVLLRALPNVGNGDPGGSTALDYGDLPGPYAACWRYFFFDANCVMQHSDVKMASTVPVTYPTLAQDNGARHYFKRDDIWLGSDVTASANGTPSGAAKLDPGPAGVSTSASILAEENGIRRVPVYNFASAPPQSSLADPRFTSLGTKGLNLFGSGCQNQEVFFTVEAHNSSYNNNDYCDPFYLNLWIDAGDSSGLNGAPDGIFQPAEYMLVDKPLWGYDMLTLLDSVTSYPYETDYAARINVASYMGCMTELPDIGFQPYAREGLQLFHFPLPAMAISACGKPTFARFRISRKPLDVFGANPYNLINTANNLPDPSVGLVNDGGEVEDYRFNISANCGSGSFGASRLCLSLVSKPVSASSIALGGLGATPDPCGSPNPPQLLGFSPTLDPGWCEFVITQPFGRYPLQICPLVSQISNQGQSNLSEVMISYVIPTNVVFQDATSSQGAWTNDAGTIRFNLGEMQVGEIAEVGLHFVPRTAGAVSVPYTISAREPLLNPEEGSGSLDMIINIPAVVSIAVAPGNLTITWAGGGRLQESSNLTTWSDVAEGRSPYPVVPNTARKFFRVMQ